MPADGLAVAAGRTVRYSRHCTVSFQTETCTSVTHVVSRQSWIKSFNLQFKHFFLPLQQRSISLRYSRFYSGPPFLTVTTLQCVCVGGANRVRDIRLHFRGVEGIELPQFPHLRHTEARDQCCLSEPLIHPVRYASFRSSLFIQPSIYPKAPLSPPFLTRAFVSPPCLSRSLCFPLVNQNIITRGARWNVPRASRITCCLPALTLPLIYYPACERCAFRPPVIYFRILPVWSCLSSQDEAFCELFSLCKLKMEEKEYDSYNSVQTFDGVELSLPPGCVLSHWRGVCSHVGGRPALPRTSGLLLGTFVDFDVVLSLSPRHCSPF